jgi:hypothetical protein
MQVRIQGIRGIVRLGARDAADALLPLAGGDDQALAHLAINALAELDATAAATKGLNGSPAIRAGALRALAQMHTPDAANALLTALSRASDAKSRAPVVHALARQYNREGYWKGDWWTTRPAHLGPYFDPAPWEDSPRIRAALVNALAASSGEEFTALVTDLAMNQVLPRGGPALLAAVDAAKDPLRRPLIEAMVGRTQLDAPTLAIATQLDAKGPVMHAAVAQMLAGESALGSAALALARTTVLDASLDAKMRGPLLTSIGNLQGQQALDVATEVFARANPAPSAAGSTPDAVEAAWRRVVGDRRRAAELDYFINLAKTGQPAQRTLAYAVLVQGIRAPRTPAPVREKVTPVIDAAWADRASAASLVQAITLMRLETQYAEKIAVYNQTKP